MASLAARQDLRTTNKEQGGARAKRGSVLSVEYSGLSELSLPRLDQPLRRWDGQHPHDGPPKPTRCAMSFLSSEGRRSAMHQKEKGGLDNV